MPTLSQKMARYQKRIRECSEAIEKYGPDAHCAATDEKIIVMEQVRAEQIANKPDAEGYQKTRLCIELYTPEEYSRFYQHLEHKMERVGHNPLLLRALEELLWMSAERSKYIDNRDGIDIAMDNLYLQADWKDMLHEAKERHKAEKRRRAINRMRQNEPSSTEG